MATEKQRAASRQNAKKASAAWRGMKDRRHIAARPRSRIKPVKPTRRKQG